jgi:hypothetical protein
MIFTRLDCGVPPFSNNPSLADCSTDGFGLRRSARAVSKKFGEGANWSKAEMCAHGEVGDEQYTLVPWRDPSWRPGMWLALGSYLNTTNGGTYHVRSELLSSGDHGKTWQRVAPRTPFIPFGAGAAWDNGGIYAAPPVADPARADCLRVYYRGSDGPRALTYHHSLPAGSHECSHSHIFPDLSCLLSTCITACRWQWPERGWSGLQQYHSSWRRRRRGAPHRAAIYRCHTQLECLAALDVGRVRSRCCAASAGKGCGGHILWRGSSTGARRICATGRDPRRRHQSRPRRH